MIGVGLHTNREVEPTRAAIQKFNSIAKGEVLGRTYLAMAMWRGADDLAKVFAGVGKREDLVRMFQLIASTFAPSDMLMALIEFELAGAEDHEAGAQADDRPPFPRGTLAYYQFLERRDARVRKATKRWNAARGDLDRAFNSELEKTTFGAIVAALGLMHSKETREAAFRKCVKSKVATLGLPRFKPLESAPTR